MPLVSRGSPRLGKRSRLNLSKPGASVSQRSGPVTINSRRRASIRLPISGLWSAPHSQQTRNRPSHKSPESGRGV
jgi:hypothetical protein